MTILYVIILYVLINLCAVGFTLLYLGVLGLDRLEEVLRRRFGKTGERIAFAVCVALASAALLVIAILLLIYP